MHQGLHQATQPALTSVGYLPKKRTTNSSEASSDTPHQNVVIGVVRLLTRTRLRAAKLLHLPHKVALQI
jgi:hypothetical protein